MKMNEAKAIMYVSFNHDQLNVDWFIIQYWELYMNTSHDIFSFIYQFYP